MNASRLVLFIVLLLLVLAVALLLPISAGAQGPVGSVPPLPTAFVAPPLPTLAAHTVIVAQPVDWVASGELVPILCLGALVLILSINLFRRR